MKIQRAKCLQLETKRKLVLAMLVLISYLWLFAIGGVLHQYESWSYTNKHARNNFGFIFKILIILSWSSSWLSIVVHWSLNSLRFYYDNDIKVLDWPPYSPNLNPIENICANMKNKLGDKKYTKGQLISKILEIWNNISDDSVKKYCGSIYDRIEEWIENKGGLTSY